MMDDAMAKRMGRHIPMSEIAKHSTADDCWVVIDGRVYDITTYLKEHPGGACPVLIKAGEDASIEYHNVHARDAHEIKEYYCIGIADEDRLPLVQIPASLGTTRRALDPRKWIDIVLAKREEISPDTRRFTFALPKDEDGNDQYLGLPIGLHVLLGAYMDDELVVRPYTPTEPSYSADPPGYVQFAIKVYSDRPNRKGGRMSQYMEALTIGDTIKMKGPAGHVLYEGRGRLAVNSKPIQVKRISMVAGGTGITPMYQLARAICLDPGDTTEIALLYANRTVKDILLRAELDELAAKYPQFKVWYTVSQAPEGKQWPFFVGRIVKHMLKTQLFPASRESLTLMCGPPAMVELTLIPNLQSLGYTTDGLFEF